MVSMRGLLYLLRTIKFSSLYNAVMTYLDNKSRIIEFKWHFKERLNWEQIRDIRNHALHGWKAVDLDFNEHFGEYIVFEKQGFKIAIPLKRFIDIYRVEDSYEPLIDYSGKTIVDVGGFVGETMILFRMWGAEVAEVYEPDPINSQVIKLNMDLNNIINTKLLCKAVWRKRENIKIGFPDSDDLHYQSLTLFPYSTSPYRLHVRAMPVEDVLHSRVDVIKLDCEGCEYSLLEVDCNRIRKIPVYVIEVHDIGPYKRDQLLEKIKRCGFEVQVITPKNSNTEHCLIKAIRF